MVDEKKPPRWRFDAPPSPLVRRKATIQLGVTNTIRFPGDIERKDPKPWFDTQSPHAPTEGNDVRFFVGGEAATTEMAAAIAETGKTAHDYVFMLNWFADLFFPLPDQPPGQHALGEMLAAKLQLGVQVRGMFWKKPLGSQNNDIVKFLNLGYATNGASEQEREAKYLPDTVSYLPQGTPAHSRRQGAAIHDERLNVTTGQISIDPLTGKVTTRYQGMTVGSHHQKVLCVKAGDSLVTFCGGIDFNPDRVALVYDVYGGAPLHDVHCRIEGPACSHILQTFVDRWNDHPEGPILDQETGEPLRVGLQLNEKDLHPDKQHKVGRVSVQMGRTFGQGPLMPGSTLPLDKRHYAFAPDGETTARSLIKNAILNAKKFIYLEDQYFVSWEATQALVQALNHGIKHLTIVIPHHAIGDLPLMVAHRRRCIKALRDAGGPRVRVFYKCGPGEKPGDYNTYVHAKVTIVDDEFAVVGSVNYNRRSWEHDSEICVGVYDPSTDQILANRFAHWLRMRLWAQHLFGIVVPPSAPEGDPKTWDDSYAELFDGVAAGVHWQELVMLEQAHADEGRDYDQSKYNPIATVRPYETRFQDEPQEVHLLPVPIFGALIEGLAGDAIWDTFLDPGRRT